MRSGALLLALCLGLSAAAGAAAVCEGAAAAGSAKDGEWELLPEVRCCSQRWQRWRQAARAPCSCSKRRALLPAGRARAACASRLLPHTRPAPLARPPAGGRRRRGGA